MTGFAVCAIALTGELWFARLMLNCSGAGVGLTTHSHKVTRLCQRQDARGVPNNSEGFAVK